MTKRQPQEDLMKMDSYRSRSKEMVLKTKVSLNKSAERSMYTKFKYKRVL